MQYELRVVGHGVTDVGKVRSKNEDSLLILDQQLVYCVADGMGGVAGGEIASQKVIQCINDQIGSLDTSVALNDKMLGIHQAVVEANKWILEWSEKNEVQGAGTTLVLLALSSEYPWAVNILHAGDSRAYRYREGQLKQVSVDHSIEQAVGDNSGQPLPSQFKGLITNAVGLKKALELELTHADQMTGDIWLLCSDGLDKMLSDEEISAVLSSDDPEDVLAQRLVDQANAAGGKDNVSVVIVKVQECSSQPEGAVSIPFPGPLPSVFEEDETSSTETSMTDAMHMETETSGSVVVSMETPDSDTDFLSKGASTGIKANIRWILLALAGVIIVVVLWNLFSGDEVSSPADVQVIAASTDAAPEEIGMGSTLSIGEIVAEAEKSGDWKRAYDLTQQGNSLGLDEQAQSKLTIDRWYEVWTAVPANRQEAIRELSEFRQAANNVFAAINSDIPPSDNVPWPAGLIVNEYCQRRYDLQQELVEELDAFCAFNGRRVNFIKMLPGESVESAFTAAGWDRGGYMKFDGLLGSTISNVQELEEMVKEWSSKPTTKDQLRALPNSRIKYVLKADTVVNQLVTVLEKDLTLNGTGNGESESIQDSLKRLVSGKMSADDEELIQRYLEKRF